MTVLLLDADVLSRSYDLADVRIVTAGNRQIPYVVEKRDEPLVLPLTISNVESPNGTSVYRLALPFPTLPYGTRLVLRTTARVFERRIELRRVADERRGRASASLATVTWRSADPELPPPAITFDAPTGNNDRALELVVDEGDNAALPLARAELLLPSVALRFHHPGSPLFLLYGNREAAEPRYDLALLAPRLFAQSARELALPSTATTPSDATQDQGALRFFWIAIGLVAVVLLVLLARLLSPRAPTASD